MTRWILLLSAVTMGVCQAGALANCPSGYPNEIFCDDFDSYASDVALRSVWYRTTPCGTEFKREDLLDMVYSPPLGMRYPSKVELGHSTVRDGGNLGLSRLIGNVFGAQYAAVAGTNNTPLVVEFFMSANASKLHFSSGFMELAYGGEISTNWANTDYGWSPACSTHCTPPVSAGPYPIICAQGNPEGGAALPPECPPVSMIPPPVHQAIAVGSLPLLDPEPCDCASTTTHKPKNTHLALYDGQLWWSLRLNDPVTSTGVVKLTDGTVVLDPPSDIYAAGDFMVSAAEYGGKSYNWVTLTIKTNTFKIEHTAQVKSIITGLQYRVTSVMDNIPRAYLGPFDRIRGGVGQGCPLASSWTTCMTGGRYCIGTPDAYYVSFDDFVLFGGAGYSVNGACCLADASCLDDTTQAGCEAQGGRWQGGSTTCNTLTCCPFPFADADHDGDVDQDDFGLFQTCYTGSDGGVPAGCDCLNRNGDDAIDFQDLEEFSKCFTGANVPAVPPPANCNP